jgi:hypothetical protein
MGIGGELRKLGQYLEDCEQQRSVDSVDLHAEGALGAPDQVTADIELTMPVPEPAADGWPMSLAATDLDEDGSIRLTLETEAVLPERTGDFDLEPADASLNADGTISVGLTASTTVTDDAETAEGDEGPAMAPVSADQQSAPAAADCPGSEEPDPSVDSGGGDRDVPPFEDVELLRSIYESCDTFDDMKEALDMDITAETVRRYMIGHDIHDPNSYDTDGDREREGDDARTAGDVEAVEDDDADEQGPADEADPTEVDGAVDSPAVVADGIGLPENVTVETLVETVHRSDTVYEVKREMDVDREEALELLRQTGLVDHVVGRLATKHQREVTREMVVERLRENAGPT